jgi:hypothetical protein
MKALFLVVLLAVAASACGDVTGNPLPPSAPTRPDVGLNTPPTVPPPPAPHIVTPVDPTPSPIPPSGPPGALTVQILAATQAAGLATTFSLTVQGGGLTQEVWTFGDGTAPLTTTLHTASHVYTAAGSYTVGVTVTDPLGRTASATLLITITGPTTPPTPPPTPAALALTMGCTIATHGTKTVCNLSATYGGTPVTSSNFTHIDVDFGDGRLDQFNNTPVIYWTYPNPGTFLLIATATVGTPEGPRTGVISQSMKVP